LKAAHIIENVLKNIDRRMAVRAVACGLVFAAACSFAGFSAKCDGIRSSVLRMHIIANSDEAKDQELKLFVRDRLLAVSSRVFDGCISEADAEAAAEENINLLQRTAEDAIRDFGSKSQVTVSVGDAWFSNREYDDFTLPAGTYKAVRVVIGNGSGHNWWCVMFPAVCLPAASDGGNDISSVLTEDETDVVKNSDKYVAKFKVVELYEDIKNRLYKWLS